MKYTFTTKDNVEKTVNIPDDFIRKNKAALGITTKEAILLYLSDEGYMDSAGVAQQKPKRKAPKRKENPTKRAIIDKIYHFIMSGQIDDALMFDRKIAPVEIVNPERVISFSIGNDRYELTLSQKRN